VARGAGVTQQGPSARQARVNRRWRDGVQSAQSDQCASSSRRLSFRLRPTPLTTDEELVARAIAGDELAMRALWAEHAPRVDAVVRRLVRDLDEAADIAQDVWIQIFRALPTFRGDAKFSTWSHRIAVNRTLNALRRARRLMGAQEELTEATVLVEDDVEQPFVRESITSALDKLPTGARTVFVLHDVEGFTHEEIATQLGITAGGSKSQLFKARARLRRLLAPLMDHLSTSTLDDEYVTPVA
jgi:RNA polymerase sigma-70 factor, ECF subfamily